MLATIGVYMVVIPVILSSLYFVILSIRSLFSMLFESIEEADITKFFFHLFLILIIASICIGIILIFISTTLLGE